MMQSKAFTTLLTQVQMCQILIATLGQRDPMVGANFRSSVEPEHEVAVILYEDAAEHDFGRRIEDFCTNQARKSGVQ